MSQADQKSISKYFSTKGILYQPGLGIVFGSVNAGILLSQLLYWHGKGKNKDGWVYKTEKDMRLETGLTRTQQENAIKRLKDLGVLEMKLAGIPAKRHFRLDLENLHNLLPSLKETCKLVYLNPPRLPAANQHSITKSTQKTTSKITSAVNRNNFQQLKNQLTSNKSIL